MPGECLSFRPDAWDWFPQTQKNATAIRLVQATCPKGDEGGKGWGWHMPSEHRTGGLADADPSVQW
jgi:hypothetical protein